MTKLEFVLLFNYRVQKAIAFNSIYFLLVQDPFPSDPRGNTIFDSSSLHDLNHDPVDSPNKRGVTRNDRVFDLSAKTPVFDPSSPTIRQSSSHHHHHYRAYPDRCMYVCDGFVRGFVVVFSAYSL